MKFIQDFEGVYYNVNLIKKIYINEWNEDRGEFNEHHEYESEYNIEFIFDDIEEPISVSIPRYRLQKEAQNELNEIMIKINKK